MEVGESGRTIDIQVRKTEFEEIAPLRALYRHDAHCQIIRDSILGRGLADPYLILVDGRVAGYADVWNEHFKDRVMEFHALPQRRADIFPMFRELLAVSGATHIEAQTNTPLMNNLLYDFATNISIENIPLLGWRCHDLELPRCVVSATGSRRGWTGGRLGCQDERGSGGGLRCAGPLQPTVWRHLHGSNPSGSATRHWKPPRSGVAACKL